MKHIDLETRCPQLGCPVPFGYCEKAGRDGKACFKVMDCWWEHFDVVGYLRERLKAEGPGEILDPPPPLKITGILEGIRQARRNQFPGSDV